MPRGDRIPQFTGAISVGDANRIKKWIERLEDGMPTTGRKPRIL